VPKSTSFASDAFVSAPLASKPRRLNQGWSAARPRSGSASRLIVATDCRASGTAHCGFQRARPPRSAIGAGAALSPKWPPSRSGPGIDPMSKLMTIRLGMAGVERPNQLGGCEARCESLPVLQRLIAPRGRPPRRRKRCLTSWCQTRRSDRAAALVRVHFAAERWPRTCGLLRCWERPASACDRCPRVFRPRRMCELVSGQ
jgi:hypothetical protein